MSHEIIKGIIFRGNVVYITSAPNNVSPRNFQKWSINFYNKIYRQKGLTGFLQEFTKDVWEGNYRLCKGSKYVNALLEAFNALERYSPDLRYFLDKDQGAQLIANAAVNYLQTHSFSSDDFSPYEALRSDPAAVLDICQKNPAAFHYAADSVRNDPKAAKDYISLCAGTPLFSFPQQFHQEKELAVLALQKNGCIYRQLSDSLKEDKDIIRLAFDANQKDRAFHEHLPDLIPPAVRKDGALMREILTSCPQLHLSRALDILNDRDTALLAARVCTPFPHICSFFPEKHLKDPEFQDIFVHRCTDAQDLKKLRSIFTERNLPNPASPLSQKALEHSSEVTNPHDVRDLNTMIARASACLQIQAGEGMAALNKQRSLDPSTSR